MLQEQDTFKNAKYNSQQHISYEPFLKHQKPLKQSQLDFEKNYPKNIFIPMIQYLAQLGLKQEYQLSVGSRQEFQGKNVVSLTLIHKLMGASWFKQNVQKEVLISNISNKILMNSKIKKKLFHLYVVQNLFQVYDQDLKQFKKKISKLANSISVKVYVQDELFEYPSSILYLLRLFFRLISINNQNKHDEISFKQIQKTSPLKMQIQQRIIHDQENTPSQESDHNQNNLEQNKMTKQGSKQEYKYYIRKIINQFNSQLLNKHFIGRFQYITESIMLREKQIIDKYNFSYNVPSWNVFISKVVEKCFQCFKKSAKITHAMMNQWISQFKQSITSVKGYIRLKQSLLQKDQKFILPGKLVGKKIVPYQFTPLILQYFPD